MIVFLPEIIDQFTIAPNKIKPNILYVPFFEDAYSDHKIIGDTYNVLGKWSRYSYKKRLFAKNLFQKLILTLSQNKLLDLINL